jgi:uncharacterized protein YjbI with pentapeptide repeats
MHLTRHLSALIKPPIFPLLSLIVGAVGFGMLAIALEKSGFDDPTLLRWTLVLTGLFISVFILTVLDYQQYLSRNSTIGFSGAAPKQPTDRQEELYQTYLSQIVELVMIDKIRSAESNNGRTVANRVTLDTLKLLDETHKGLLVQFLHEVNLVTTAEDTQPIVHLENSDLVRAKLNEAQLAGIALVGAEMMLANLQGADLRDATLDGTNLTWAILTWSNLQRASLIETILIGANLQRANLVQAKLTGADIRGAKLTWADMVLATVTDADLRGADLRGANMDRANLNGANLCGAELERADLRGARLRGALLEGAKINSTTKFDEQTILPDGSRWSQTVDMATYTHPQPDHLE